MMPCSTVPAMVRHPDQTLHPVEAAVLDAHPGMAHDQLLDYLLLQAAQHTDEALRAGVTLSVAIVDAGQLWQHDPGSGELMAVPIEAPVQPGLEQWMQAGYSLDDALERVLRQVVGSYYRPWHDLEPHALQAMRRLLFFSVTEAAALVGQVEPRTWQRWEDGSRGVPPDVAHRVRQLLAWRNANVATLEQWVVARGPGPLFLVWYPTLADWVDPQHHAQEWRPHASAVAEVAGRHGAQLRPFVRDDYLAWLGERADEPHARQAWANGG